MYRITLDKIDKVNTNTMQRINIFNTKTMQNRQCKYVIVVGEGAKHFQSSKSQKRAVFPKRVWFSQNEQKLAE